jgi:hypothetical protein
MACSAIHVFPEPVGAVTRQSAFFMARTASSWNGSGSNGLSSGIPIFANIFFRLLSAFALVLKRATGTSVL